MKFLIMGRTGRGKNFLQNELENMYGWKFVKSYTTRPKRTPDEDTYTFVTPEEAAQIPMKDRIAYNKIGEYEYFTTKDRIKDADAFVIDPAGLKYLCKTMPNNCFHVMYIRADEDEAEKHAMQRGDAAVEQKRFHIRSKAEDAQFTEFEEFMETPAAQAEQLLIDKFTNDFSEITIQRVAAEMDRQRTYYANIEPIIRALIRAGVMDSSDGEHINLVLQSQNSGETKVKPVTIERMSQIIYDPRQGPIAQIMLSWLSLPGTAIVEDGNADWTPDTSFIDNKALVESILKESIIQKAASTFNLKLDAENIYKDIMSDDDFISDFKDLVHKHVCTHVLDMTQTSQTNK